MNEVNKELIDSVNDNDNLNEKQKLFCLYYIKRFNATIAYQKAYECDYNTANVNGARLLVNASITDEIAKLRDARFNQAMIKEEDIFQQMMDIAFSDVTDFVNVRSNTLSFKDVSTFNGQAVSEISMDKGVPKLKLHDKMRALEWLADRMDLLPTYTREKLTMEQMNLEHKIGDSDKDKSINITIQSKEVDIDADN